MASREETMKMETLPSQNADQTDLISALNSLLTSFKISVICKSKRKGWIKTEIVFIYI